MTARQILIAEDEAMIAMMLEDFLDILGHGVAGIHSSVAECEAALAAIDPSAPGIDAVILDRNLADGPAWPVATRLNALGIPVLLASGDGSAVPDGIHVAALLSKPYTLESLGSALDAMLSADG